MTSEQLEYQISQYLDGTLNEFERQQLEAHLATNPAARELLREYQKLDSVLRSGVGLPAVNWDRFAQHVSDQLADEPVPAKIYVMPVWRRVGTVAMAASVAIAVSLGVWIVLKSETNTGQISPAAVVRVTGPAVEQGTDAGTLVVQLAPPSTGNKALTIRVRDDAMAARPARLIIASGATAVPADAERLLPF